MKTLTGSPKQMEWAEQIRENYFKNNFNDKLLKTLSFFKEEHDDEDGTLHLGHFPEEFFFTNDFGIKELDIQKLENKIKEVEEKIKEVGETQSATYWINNRDNTLLKQWIGSI